MEVGWRGSHEVKRVDRVVMRRGMRRVKGNRLADDVVYAMF